MSSEGGTSDYEADIHLSFEPQFIDSLDAKILQYKYALVKLKSLIDALDVILNDVPNRDSSGHYIILIQYIIFLSSNLFAINESGFSQKLAALENFKIPKSLNVPVSKVLTHVPYDTKDQPVTPLVELPSSSVSIAALKAFRALCLNCQDAYQKRYDNASEELKNDKFLSDLDSLFTHKFFNPKKDFDLTLTSALTQRSSVIYSSSSGVLSMIDDQEASLIDFDLCSLLTITWEVSDCVNAQKSSIVIYKNLKPSPLRDHQLRNMPYYAYSLHKILFCALRINDLYFITRRYCRQILTSNHDHLHDRNFVTQMSNVTRFCELRQNMEDSFLTTKKNGVLIATITRFVRMNSRYDINAKNIFDLFGFISQSITYLESLLTLIKQFTNIWIVGEIAFRKAHKLPVVNLYKLAKIMDAENVKQAQQVRLNASIAQKHVNNSGITRQSNSKESSPMTQQLRAKEKIRVNGTAANVQVEKTSAASSSRASSNDTSSTTKSTLFLHKQISSSSLGESFSPTSNTSEKNEAVSTTSNGRRRSSSQPLSFNAAAVALKNNRTPPPPGSVNSLRSPSGSIRRTNSLTRNSAHPSITSPLSKKSSVPIVPEEQKEEELQSRSAKQRFQQHLLEASKSGALYGKEKETFSNVVFDPNNPSAFKVKRSVKHEKVPQVENVPHKEEPRSEQHIDAPKTLAKSVHTANAAPPSAAVVSSRNEQKSSRAQITKLNTKRNSVLVQVEETEVHSDISRNSVISESSQSSNTNESLLVKKVRFSGVPNYTPAEDAPSSQSSRILKSFAALKIPSVSRNTFKQKDNDFKMEESLHFKQYLSMGEHATLRTDAAIGTVSSSGNSKLARFRNKF